MLFWGRRKYSFKDLAMDTDIHCHLVPGVDDGSRTLESSFRVMRIYEEYGLKNMVITPHICGSLFPNSSEDLRRRFDELRESVRKAGIGLNLHLAAEYMVDESFRTMFKDPLLMPDGKHVLIEMSYYQKSPNIFDEIFALNMDGYLPILAHPERYVFYHNRSGERELEKLVDSGCELQLNVLSLTGAYGSGSMAVLRHLLGNNLYSYIGTDTHSSRQIPDMTDFRVSSSLMEKVRELSAANEALLRTGPSL